MKNNKINVVLSGLAVVVFLTGGFVGFEKIKQLESEVNRLNSLIIKIDAKIKTLTDLEQTKQKELESIKKDFDNSKRELDSFKTDLDSAKTELDRTKTDLDSAKTELNSVNKKFDSLTAKPKALKK